MSVEETVDFAEFQAVCRLLDAANRHHDARASEAWVALFTEDATYSVHGEAYVGADGLRRFLRNRRDGAGKHHCGVPLVTVLAADHYVVETDYFGFRRGAEGIVVGGTGRYRDVLRKRDGRWLIAERRITGVLQSPRDITEPRTAAIFNETDQELP
jgi:hypothetical protein